MPRAGISILVLTLGLIQLAPTDQPGSLLKPGMELIYSSSGQELPPWYVDSIRVDHSLRPASACAVTYMRRPPGQSQTEESRLCISNDTLFGWISERSEWRAQRPVGPHMVLEYHRQNGDKVRFQTAEAGEEQISGMTIPVIATTLTTSDSLGRPKQRLRERYSVGLATATGGVFEIPDSTTEGEWQTRQAFELREIRTP